MLNQELEPSRPINNSPWVVNRVMLAQGCQGAEPAGECERGTVPWGWDSGAPNPAGLSARTGKGWGAAARQRGSAGCGGRGDSDTGADGVRQGQNSPLMQVEKQGAGSGTAAVSRGTPGSPGSRSTTNTREKAGVAGAALPAWRPGWAVVQPDRTGRSRLPAATVVPQLPGVSSSRLGLQQRRNPRAALPGARPGHLHRDSETQEFYLFTEEQSAPHTRDAKGQDSLA